MTWARMNNGKPIVTPQWVNFESIYGAGQPSVVYKDGLFYMLYTDTTGIASGGPNSPYGYNSLYVLRSPDPTFQIDLESLGNTGFIPYDPLTHTSYPFMGGASIDWVFSDQLGQWIVALDGPDGSATVLYFWNEELTELQGTLNVAGTWTEGPGILSRPDHHAPANAANPGLVPIDLFRSVGPQGDTSDWMLGHIGADIQDTANSVVDYASVFDGSVISYPNGPGALIIGGVRLQFEVGQTLSDIARTWYTVSQADFEAIPYGASIFKGNTVYSAPGRPAAFLNDDGKLWPIGCDQLVTDNQSNVTEIATAKYDSYPQGSILFCVGVHSPSWISGFAFDDSNDDD